MKKDADKKTIIGQIGLGNWGQNLLKNFYLLPDCKLKYACDFDRSKTEKFSKIYPDVIFTDNYDEILEDKEVSAIVVAIPAVDHYSVAKKVLERNKHVFIEKPITLKFSEAQELVELAQKVNKKIMVGHLMLYHPAIIKLKQLIKTGELGDIYCIYTHRLNLGTIRKAENAMWSLAPHDISIILHLLDEHPQTVFALGSSFIQSGIEDVVYLSMKFSSGKIGHVHVSWLDPNKKRQTVVVGSRKMAVFDEVSEKETLVLFDKGVELNNKLTLRDSGKFVIEVDKETPLKLECEHFIESIKNGSEPLSNGKNGLDVLKVLTSAQKSLENGKVNELF
ncbi:hypothetical protein A2230_08415 [candidate division WOR-1 bacterium RIFOXYA2_FULL_36_21]|uniref:Oxidoreductase n=1 Tax=candidate division WOR-1 bacterium RIFOXYB2_FULL_36_35 TaxID=1802578 RepID=A0A1F4SAA8_UNCSA|nr:MAG: hypothetical protein A2230_08415 [candidate division WOR-1 bacterium RIFOXYA2_FULL_36_21]OGC15331.1 MAG: hypothetical protein A2282_06165 [candidate division WOR-1 bacterium RIFOXYA12_FULL_36_13]OGC16673.1 MAG: hypothetical protein A2290_03630 [candidate division WOR-1 bacterium RIFOXYB2_FULL_36_35]